MLDGPPRAPISELDGNRAFEALPQAHSLSAALEFMTAQPQPRNGKTGSLLTARKAPIIGVGSPATRELFLDQRTCRVKSSMANIVFNRTERSGHRPRRGGAGLPASRIAVLVWLNHSFNFSRLTPGGPGTTVQPHKPISLLLAPHPEEEKWGAFSTRRPESFSWQKVAQRGTRVGETGLTGERIGDIWCPVRFLSERLLLLSASPNYCRKVEKMKNLWFLCLVAIPLLVERSDQPPPAGFEHWTLASLEKGGQALSTEAASDPHHFAVRLLADYPNEAFMLVHREADGQAEWHETQIDVILVQSGTATLLVGGTLVGGETVAPHEKRNGTIQGGTRVKLSAGDVVRIPPHAPHQLFLEGTHEFNYFVVKVKGY